jgi:hypothetical protein
MPKTACKKCVNIIWDRYWPWSRLLFHSGAWQRRAQLRRPGGQPIPDSQAEEGGRGQDAPRQGGHQENIILFSNAVLIIGFNESTGTGINTWTSFFLFSNVPVRQDTV